MYLAGNGVTIHHHGRVLGVLLQGACEALRGVARRRLARQQAVRLQHQRGRRADGPVELGGVPRLLLEQRRELRGVPQVVRAGEAVVCFWSVCACVGSYA